MLDCDNTLDDSDPATVSAPVAADNAESVADRFTDDVTKALLLALPNKFATRLTDDVIDALLFAPLDKAAARLIAVVANALLFAVPTKAAAKLIDDVICELLFALPTRDATKRIAVVTFALEVDVAAEELDSGIAVDSAAELLETPVVVAVSPAPEISDEVINAAATIVAVSCKLLVRLAELDAAPDKLPDKLQESLVGCLMLMHYPLLRRLTVSLY